MTPDTAAKVAGKGLGEILTPLHCEAKLPLASTRGGFHLLFFRLHFVRAPLGSFIKTTSKRAAMTQGTGMRPWESLPSAAAAPGMAWLSLLLGEQLNLPLSPASGQTRPQPLKKLLTPTAILHGAFVPSSPICPSLKTHWLWMWITRTRDWI